MSATDWWDIAATVCWIVNICLWYHAGKRIGYRDGFMEGGIEGAKEAIRIILDRQKGIDP